MTDHEIWRSDIINRFAPSSLTDSQTEDGIVATSVISAVTTNSGMKLSLSDAYEDLRGKLLEGEVRPLLMLTTTQRDALTSVTDGIHILNITIDRIEFFDDGGGGTWLGADESKRTFGDMFEDNSGGSSISVSTSYAGWVTATVGTLGVNGLVTFVNNGTADRLTVGTGGAGKYRAGFHANVTNSGGKLTTGAIHVNDVEQTNVKMSLPGDSSKAVNLSGGGIITLTDNDFVDLRFKSEDTDTVDVFQVNLNIERLQHP